MNTEGWMAEKSIDTPRYHYMVDALSLCRRFGLYKGELEIFDAGKPPQKSDCKACHKLAVKRFEKGEMKTYKISPNLPMPRKER